MRIEGFRRILGDPIYGEILRRVAHARRASDIPNAQVLTQVAEAMERASRGVHKAHSLSESIGDTQLISLLDRLHIGTITAIPNLKALRTLVAQLEGLAGSPAARFFCAAESNSQQPRRRRDRAGQRTESCLRGGVAGSACLVGGQRKVRMVEDVEQLRVEAEGDIFGDWYFLC